MEADLFALLRILALPLANLIALGAIFVRLGRLIEKVEATALAHNRLVEKVEDHIKEEVAERVEILAALNIKPKPIA